MTSAVVYAYHGFGVCGLESLVRQGVCIRQVVSHRDHPGERCWWRSVAERCRDLAIPCELDADLRDPATVARLTALRPDLILSCYYRSLIPMTLLAAPLGAWNLHGSLLPRFRGRAPINWQLVHGEPRAGLTLHRMLQRADAGDILAQIAVDVHPDQDAFGLAQQLLAVCPAFLDTSLADLLAGRATPWPQDEAQATVFPGRRPEDGRIDWTLPARRIHNLVRAVAPPWPGAFTICRGERLIIRRSAVADEGVVHGEPGRVLTDGSIACGHGRLVVLEAGRGDSDDVVDLICGEMLRAGT
jgi:methionyl-tRNA formyltransferase